MKKKTSSSKKSKKKPVVVQTDFDGENLSTKIIYDDNELSRLMANIEESNELALGVTFPLCIHPDNLCSLADDGSARITVIVAETLTYEKEGKPARYKMESGRMAAQVAHATSALRMEYILANCRGNNVSAIDIVNTFRYSPITTITLKARDCEELQHIIDLAEKADVLYASFEDDNERVYGTSDRILTAVAIGPLSKTSLQGITDYLPLWTDGL